jgi:hypothetical protein
MSRSKWIASACILLATFALVSGYILSGQESLTPVLVIAGALWLIAFHRQWAGINTLAFVIMMIAAGYGVLLSCPAGLMLIALVSAISAWDLDAMIDRFHQVKPEALEAGIERKHLSRLAIVDTISLVLGGAALVIRIHFSLAIGLILGLVLFAGASQIVIYLRRSRI